MASQAVFAAKKNSLFKTGNSAALSGECCLSMFAMQQAVFLAGILNSF
jgi:hypothetical protein